MNRRLGVSLTVLAVVWLWLVATYIPDIATEGEPGPRAFPFALGTILGVLGIALALQPADVGRVRPGDVGRNRPRTGNKGPAADPPNRKTAIAVATIALLLAYAFVLDKAGFIISTIAFIVVAMMGILGMRRWLLIGSLAVVFTLACWVVFVSVLGVPLPGGSWMQ